MRVETFPTREAWLEARRLGLGGSDVPAALSISPWRTPLQVWSEKVGLETEQSGETYSMRRGVYMERMLAGEIEREVEETRDDDSLIAGYVGPADGSDKRYISVVGDEPWMRYSPDGFLNVRDRRDGSESKSLVEFKSHPRGASEWSEGIPPHVNAQVQYGMVVCDLPACYVAVDLGTDFRWTRIERDPAWAEENLPKLRAFWELVQSETPPEPTGDEGDRNVLQAMWPKPQGGLTVALGPDVLDLAWEFDELSKQQGETKKRLETLKAQIEFALKDAEMGVLPDGSAFTWKVEGQKARPQPAWEKRVLRRKKAKER